MAMGTNTFFLVNKIQSKLESATYFGNNGGMSPRNVAEAIAEAIRENNEALENDIQKMFEDLKK